MDKFDNTLSTTETSSAASVGNLDGMDNNQEQPEPGNSNRQDTKSTFVPLFEINETKAKVVEPPPEEKSLKEMGFDPEEAQNWKKAQPPKPKLNTLLKTMIDQNIMPNVEIKIGGKSFKCHLIVLQCYSIFFKEFTNEVVIQLPEEKVTAQAFAKIYNWMLTENPIVKPDGIMELFVASRFLKIDELMRQCWYCFGDSDCFREDTAFIMYLEAGKFDQQDLEQLMLTRVCKFFLTVVSSKEFLELSQRQVCALLNSSAIGVNSEIEVLLAAVRWLTHDWEKREQYQVEVAKCVRFNLMPSWYLVTITKEAVAPEVLKVLKHPDVRQMIADGLSVVTTQMFYKNNNEEFQQFVKRMELTPSPQRIWICDKQCEYHYCSWNRNMASSTYELFNDYLEIIRSQGINHWQMVQLTTGETASSSATSTSASTSISASFTTSN